MEADPEGAFHDFQAAAQQGDAYAIFNLGYMYLRGLHVPVNYTVAKDYFEKAVAKNQVTKVVVLRWWSYYEVMGPVRRHFTVMARDGKALPVKPSQA